MITSFNIAMVVLLLVAAVIKQVSARRGQFKAGACCAFVEMCIGAYFAYIGLTTPRGSSVTVWHIYVAWMGGLTLTAVELRSFFRYLAKARSST